ncbi:hypothetical protein DLH94_24730, partial [Vibrio parahaemolyticus]|nr:hypothetical protein [Vibrio parahaemolyticus]
CLNYGDSGIAIVKIGDYRHIQCLNYGDFGIAHCLRLVIIGTSSTSTMVILGSQPLNTGDYRHIQHLSHGDFRIATARHW